MQTNRSYARCFELFDLSIYERTGLKWNGASVQHHVFVYVSACGRMN